MDTITRFMAAVLAVAFVYYLVYGLVLLVRWLF